jgi:hypothetical protein
LLILLKRTYNNKILYKKGKKMKTKITTILTTVEKDLLEKRNLEIREMLEKNKHIEKVYLRKTIPLKAEISLLRSNYKEELSEKEISSINMLKENENIKNIHSLKQYLTVEVDMYDPCVNSTDLLLVTEAEVEILEDESEYLNRIIEDKSLLNEREYILNNINFEIDKRILILTVDTKKYFFDIKIQNIDKLLRILKERPKSEFYRELIMFDKQIILREDKVTMSIFISLLEEKGLELNYYEKFCIEDKGLLYKINIPLNILLNFSKENLLKYKEGLYLFSFEESLNWSKGLYLLKELGFLIKNNESFKPKMQFVFKG